MKKSLDIVCVVNSTYSRSCLKKRLINELNWEHKCNFCNRNEWICRAITKALQLYKHSPLDVVLVHYGSVVRSQFLSSVPNIGKPLPEEDEESKKREEEEIRRKSITAQLAKQVMQKMSGE